MGLEEKRWIEQFKSQYLPSVQADLDQVLGGGGVAFEVDYASFSSDVEALKNLEDQLRRVNDAFRTVTRHSGGASDDVALKAVKDGLKKIVVKRAASPDQKKFTVANGVAELHTAVGRDGGTVMDYDMKEALEAAL